MRHVLPPLLPQADGGPHRRGAEQAGGRGRGLRLGTQGDQQHPGLRRGRLHEPHPHSGALPPGAYRHRAPGPDPLRLPDAGDPAGAHLRGPGVPGPLREIREEENPGPGDPLQPSPGADGAGCPGPPGHDRAGRAGAEPDGADAGRQRRRGNPGGPPLRPGPAGSYALLHLPVPPGHRGQGPLPGPPRRGNPDRGRRQVPAERPGQGGALRHEPPPGQDRDCLRASRRGDPL